MTAVLYYTVAYIAARVDFSWNGIFWDRSCQIQDNVMECRKEAELKEDKLKNYI